MNRNLGGNRPWQERLVAKMHQNSNAQQMLGGKPQTIAGKMSECCKAHILPQGKQALNPKRMDCFLTAQRK